MKNILQPMTDFVLAQIEWNKENKKIEKEHSFSDMVCLERIESYAKFLKQPLTLSMFVPVSESGEVLTEPTNIEKMQASWMDNPIDDNFYRVRDYEKAKSRCLFEGFKMCDRGDETCVMTDSFHLNGFIWKDKTIETLVGYKITLSEAALKQIYV
jgi:hypothetical protein